MNTIKNTHGGKRDGAGRPTVAIERRYRSVWLSDKEYGKVKEFIKILRGN